MSKKPKKKGKQERIASNADWLHASLESTPLDLDALASMPIKEVKSDLKQYKASTNAQFLKELNAKLPEGTAISVSKAETPKKRQTRKTKAVPSAQDRKPAQRTQSSSLRIFSIRNALVLSGIIIFVALVGPYSLTLLNQSAQEQASGTISQPDSTEDASVPPTRLEVTFPNIRVRGVTYTLENFQGLVPQFSPLPSNPDTLDKTFTFLAMIDSDGNIVGLQPEHIEEHPFEKVIMDSLLQWKFYGGEAADTTSGKIMVTYKTN